MSGNMRRVPAASYGILNRHSSEGLLDDAAEMVRVLGYTIFDAGYAEGEVEKLSRTFDAVRNKYVELHGKSFLESINEQNSIRLMMMHGEDAFVRLALNSNLLAVVGRLIEGKFTLSQQNGVINPPDADYSQGAWHRDLPYQHFVSSTPLAVTALFCIDDFSAMNGATFVLPASHRLGAFPSRAFVESNATQVEARAGQFILMDCMTFHAGGFNGTGRSRRAVNHLYGIPYFKQQINIPKNIDGSGLTPPDREILGFGFEEPDSVKAYLGTRRSASASRETP